MPPLPLPEGWTPAEHLEDQIDISGLVVRRAGVSSIAPTGEEVTGAAASLDESPAARAGFELVERAGTLLAVAGGGSVALRSASGSIVGEAFMQELFPISPDPAKYRPARSNGVALHETWGEACRRARAELVERHRVLRSWYGEVAPERVPVDPSWPIARDVRGYDWRAYRMGSDEGPTWARGVAVRAIFGIPLSGELPFIAAFGAESSPAAALRSAEKEALQSLAFLWGEDLPQEEPSLPVGPSQNLARLLWGPHRRSMLDWLERGHGRHWEKLPAGADPSPSLVFADLTPAHLEGGLRLAMAVHPAAERLYFGDAPAAAHLPAHLRLVPIP